MKYLTLFSTLLALASAAPLAEVTVAEDVQAEKPYLDMTANGVKILPRFKDTKPKDGATRSEVVIGRYSISSLAMTKSIASPKGPPCGFSGCFVTAMEATIRYPDGKEANIDTGAWLHHIALFASPVGLASGKDQMSLWACGNERPTLRLNDKSKFGLDWPSSYYMIIDLMSEEATSKKVDLVLTFEWVPKSASGYKAAQMYWLTVGEPAAQTGSFKFKTLPMSTTGGKLLYSIGHMHDGGTEMALYKSGSSTPICRSVMHYNMRPGYTPTKGHKKRDGPGGHSGAGMEHISDPGACTDFGELASGDRIYAEALYDARLHPLMTHNGKNENLMGNMRVYMGTK